MFILLTLCLLTFTTFQMNISSIFSPPIALNNHIYTITSNQKYIHAVLTKSHMTSPTFLIMKTTPFTPPTNRNDWMHINPFLSTQYDYQGLVTGRNQYAWLLNPGIGLTIFFQIINFQPLTASAYTITVSESNNWLYSCLPYATYKSTNYCLSCPAMLEGVLCTINSHLLKADSPIDIKMAASSYNSFLIAADGSSISLKIQVKNGILMAYFQQVKYKNEHAGIVNYLPEDSSNSLVGFVMLSHGKQYNFDNIAYGKYPISVGMINTNANSSVHLIMTFTLNEEINILVVVIGIVGGILLLALIIAVIILIRKYRSDATVIPQIFRPSQQKLNQQEINVYFPAVTKSAVMCLGTSTLVQMVEKQQEQKSEFECAICISPMMPGEMIRVCYCKHIFHSNCLGSWFKKQQNCPYCRQDYSRQATLALYSSLSQQAGRSLQGAQLAKEILKQKMNATLQTMNFTSHQF